MNNVIPDAPITDKEAWTTWDLKPGELGPTATQCNERLEAYILRGGDPNGIVYRVLLSDYVQAKRHET